ncbi:MAG: PD40 domain-containing protein [Bacteroidales bacterium]|nr:PD40 domain-containing protein [Bacteroidales bacterium]
MRKCNKILLTIILVLLSLPALSQNATDIVNKSVNTYPVENMVLPGGIEDWWQHDGNIHANVDGMLFLIPVANGVLGQPIVDTVMIAVDPQMTFSAVHPSTGRFYYTKRGSKGQSQLYEYYEKKPGRFANKREKMSGFSYSVEHPTFSADGRVMVFVSDNPLGFGGKDLWFSEWRNDEWQYPQNLGHIINSSGDDFMPMIYGDYLVFASDGREHSYGGADFYATRLVAVEQTGDTVSMFPIGKCPVHSLHAPFCSSKNDVSMVMGSGNSGWWLVKDTSGSEKIFSFQGRLDCLKMSGHITDADGRSLRNAKVTVSRDNSDVVYDADDNGSYTVFLQPDMSYKVSFWAPGFFSMETVCTKHVSESGELYNVEKNDVVLHTYFFDSVYTFPDIFASSVSSDITPAGRVRLDAFARFLMENRDVKLIINSSYDLSKDAPFCSLVNNSRLRVLRDYLITKGVSQNSVDTTTNKPYGKEETRVDNADVSPSIISSRTVSFILKR